MSRSKRAAPAHEVRRLHPEAICRAGLTGFSVLIGTQHDQVLASGPTRLVAWRHAADQVVESPATRKLTGDELDALITAYEIDPTLEGRYEVLAALQELRDARTAVAAPILAVTAQSAQTLLELIQEVLRAGNANTRALKQAVHRASPSWMRRAREAVAEVITDEDLPACCLSARRKGRLACETHLRQYVALVGRDG